MTKLTHNCPNILKQYGTLKLGDMFRFSLNDINVHIKTSRAEICVGLSNGAVIAVFGHLGVFPLSKGEVVSLTQE